MNMVFYEEYDFGNVCHWYKNIIITNFDFKMDKKNLEILWQSTYFAKDEQCSDSVANGAKQADALRNLIFQLHYAKASNSLSYSCWEHLVEEFMNEYSEVVDDQLGLNNYSEGALFLAANRKSESSAWKSTLAELSKEELMKFIPDDTSLQEDTDDLQQLLDVLNKEDVTEDMSTFPVNMKLESCPSRHFQQPVWSTAVINGNEEHKSFSTEVTLPTSSRTVLTSSANNSFYSTESKRMLNIDFASEPKLFAVAARDVTDMHAGSLQKRKYVSVSNKNLTTVVDDQPGVSTVFRTAREKFVVEQQKKPNRSTFDSGITKKCLGSRRGLNSKFISPLLSKQDDARVSNSGTFGNDQMDTRLKNVDPKMIEMILNEIMDNGPPVSWDDIAGLDFAKATIKEIVVWPMLRPDLFCGLRGPPKGILLFGPPGTGKTMIGKCIAFQSKSTFFSISASSLTSKWIGDGEKMVRALFDIARSRQPSVIFIDEIDSLLSQRSETEHESSRRLKTEFLVQFDGVMTCGDERLLVVGATNRPHELDEAARRRLVKRLYIPLPECTARKHIVTTLLSKDKHTLSEDDLEIICKETNGYSGADMTNLCKEASLGPIRSIQISDIEHISTDQVRPIVLQDFLDALKQVRASVSDKDLESYLNWNKQYGCISVIQ